MNLGELIKRLEEANQEQIVKIGFGNPHSYRGYYSEVAFEIQENVTVQHMLNSAKEALGTTYEGWKGGDYTMDEYVYCYLVVEEGHTGEQIGEVLIKYMLEEV
jgi:hypothetical protein